MRRSEEKLVKGVYEGNEVSIPLLNVKRLLSTTKVKRRIYLRYGNETEKRERR